MISPAPGCISRKFRSAVGLDTPSHSVALSRWRSANEYTVGSVLSKYPEATKTPKCAIAPNATAAGFSSSIEQAPFYIPTPGIPHQMYAPHVRSCAQYMYATYVG